MKTHRCEGKTDKRTKGTSGHLRCKNRVTIEMPGKGFFCHLHESQNHYIKHFEAIEKIIEIERLL